MALSEPARRLVAGFSLEVTAANAASVRDAARWLPPGTPVSITYLPGETSEARQAAAALIRSLRFLPVPHVSARRLASPEHLKEYLSGLARRAGLDRALVVAGDCRPAGPFEDALAVIRSGQLAQYGVRRVGIAGYPQGHPDIPEDRLWQALADKHRLLLKLGHEPIITTQFAFDADAMVAWIGDVRDRGIESTIRLGVPGPAAVQSLLRFAARCGVSASARVMRKYGLSITRLMNVAGPDQLVEDLAACLDPARHGDVQIHIYPFGGLARAAEWVGRQLEPATPDFSG
jgi:methylenetetrahydrofolate reductase (NADPH)